MQRHFMPGCHFERSEKSYQCVGNRSRFLATLGMMEPNRCGSVVVGLRPRNFPQQCESLSLCAEHRGSGIQKTGRSSFGRGLEGCGKAFDISCVDRGPCREVKWFGEVSKMGYSIMAQNTRNINKH
jgi:hypothetical protein